MLSNKQLPKVPLQISKERKVCSEIKKSDTSKNLFKNKDASPTSSNSTLNVGHNIVDSTGGAAAINDFSCNTRAIDDMIDENLLSSRSKYQAFPNTREIALRKPIA